MKHQCLLGKLVFGVNWGYGLVGVNGLNRLLFGGLVVIIVFLSDKVSQG